METKKLTNQDVLLIFEALKYLSDKETKAWYGISRNLQKIKPLTKSYHELKNEIIEKCAEKDEQDKVKYSRTENGIEFSIIPDKLDEFREATNSLDNEEVKEIDWYKIKMDKLDDLKLDAVKLEVLLDIIIEE